MVVVMVIGVAAIQQVAERGDVTVSSPVQEGLVSNQPLPGEKLEPQLERILFVWNTPEGYVWGSIVESPGGDVFGATPVPFSLPA